MGTKIIFNFQFSIFNPTYLSTGFVLLKLLLVVVKVGGIITIEAGGAELALLHTAA